MFDIKLIRKDPEAVRTALSRRRTQVDYDTILALDADRRKLIYESDLLRAEQNKASEDIARAKRWLLVHQVGSDSSATQQDLKMQAVTEDLNRNIEAMRLIKTRIAEYEEKVRDLDGQLTSYMLTIPNLPDESVPVGLDDSENRVERTWGEPRAFSFEPKDHVAIGEGLGIFDFERAAKLAGSRFTLSKGAGACLERALINFMLDTHTREHGYTEVLPPFMVNSQAMQGTGQLPKFAGDLFRLEATNYWLIPTAEVPVTNIFAGEILDEAMLPVYYTAYTPCFRSEAGAAGKDTRGMIRVHQFNKVEMVKFTTPETSWDELEKLTGNAETILQKLELPYRVVTLCSGDLGFSSAKTYDLEVWLPGQNMYREISSCSNFLDFQARRANIRYRPNKGKPEFVHTLNGSGLAVGRTVVAIVENYQQEDGTVIVPEALRPYMGGMERIGG